MINVLIPTRPDDTHAIFVKLALEKIGHNVDLWYTADFPSQQTHSLEISNSVFSWRTQEINREINNRQYDIVWYRRPAKPILLNMLHPEDVGNAKNENMTMFQSLWHVILPDAVWINPVLAVKANSKLLQLKLAANIGIKIPNTLISNNPNDIRKYIQKGEGNVVYKSLHPMTWLNRNEIRLTYTSPIKICDLPSNDILQCTPGIFQERIDKKYELRVTYFGSKYIAVKIYSQEHDKAKIDWRSAPTKELKLEKVPLPDKLDEQCRELMKKLGIVFGCFDFIVTPDDEYYFLEINEQGQFLWIEDVNPEIKMLGSFIEFLLSYDGDDQSYTSNISLCDFIKDVEYIKTHAESIHINSDKY